MARLDISRKTLVSLFAKSGNLCAFPGCTHELVSDTNVFVAQICHIEAARPGGQRYNALSNDDSRRDVGNLLLLCYKHHKETDDVTAYPSERLRKIKANHESTYANKPFKINEAFLHRLEQEISSYWESIEQAKVEHIAPDFAVYIDGSVNAANQFKRLSQAIEGLSSFHLLLANSDKVLNEEIRGHFHSLGYDLTLYDGVSYYKNPFYSRSWEIHELAVRNAMTDLLVSLEQCEVRFLEEYIKTNPNDKTACTRLAEVREQLLISARSAGYAD